MGVTASRQSVETFQTNLAETLNSSTQTISQSAGATTSTRIALRIENLSTCGGDITISNINQTATVKINFSQLATAESTSQFKTAMQNALTSLVEKDTTIKNELGGVGVTSDEQFNRQVNENITKMVNAVTESSMSSIASTMNTEQEANLLNFNILCGPGKYGAGNITINGISQTVQLEFVAAQVASLASAVYQDIYNTNTAAIEAGQTLYVENTGFATLVSAWFSGITGIIVTIIIVLALLIAIIVVPVVVLKRKAKKKAAALLGAPGAAKAAATSVATTGPEEAVIKETGTVQELASNPQVQQGFKKATGFIGNLLKKK